MQFDVASPHVRPALAEWLTLHLPGASGVEVGELARPEMGASSETFIVPVCYQRGGRDVAERLVLRVEVDEPAIYPQQVPGLDVEIDIQYRVMEAIAKGATAPVAEQVAYESNREILGNEFFVMRYVGGSVLSLRPQYAESGFFVDAGTEQRRRVIDDGLRRLAQLHSLDWRAVGLEWLSPPGATPGTARQLDIWIDYLIRELGGREHPLLDEATTWLQGNVPVDEPVGFSWGDARPGNMIFDDFRCACVTDFENASIAPPWLDLGWWLMFDRCSHEQVGLPRLAGEPTREEQVEMYEAHAGRSAGDLHYHQVFAAFRYAAIVIRVMNRYAVRGQAPPDQNFWKDNGPVRCLDELLAAS